MRRTLVALAVLLSFVAAVPGAFAAGRAAAAVPVTAVSPVATVLQLPSPVAPLPQSSVDVPRWLEIEPLSLTGCGNTCLTCNRIGGLCCFQSGGGCFCSDYASGCT